MDYKSTRGSKEKLTSSQAILKGLADDGGLYMPSFIPVFGFPIENMLGNTYRETAYEVMKLYFDDYAREELQDCIAKAYDEKFDVEDIVALAKAENTYYLELFHGKTIAFKDMALSLLPYLMRVAAKKNKIKDTIVILTATSGDTGKAAMEGFADVEGTEIIVFYPKGGVSNMQELQMRTQRGKNTHVVALHGNFDDAQSAVKKIFANQEFSKRLAERGMRFSSANSINIGRLIPQIVYYVHAYLKLLAEGEIESGEKINICVPTGNFGNILAAYMAKKMGLPVDRLICASNENKVLYDFFKEGMYDRRREFFLTASPSMDILISSNLERLIYLSGDCNTKKTADLMKELGEKGSYTIDTDMREYMSDFYGGFAGDQECSAQIRKIYEKIGYVLDPHTAVASSVYEMYKKESGDEKKTLIVSTASPYKFARTVENAIRGEQVADEWELIQRLYEDSRTEIPSAIREIQNAKIRHNTESELSEIDKIVAEILKL